MRQRWARFAGDRRGLSTVVESVLMMVLLMAFFGGFSAFVLAAHARTVVIAAADSAARTASIECGLGAARWQADAVAAGQQALIDGGLHLGTTDPGQPGYWSVGLTVVGACPGGSQVTAAVQYDQANLFPPLGPMLGQGPAGALAFTLTSRAVFPVE